MESSNELKSGSLEASEKVWSAVVEIAEKRRIQPGGKLPSVRVLASELQCKPSLVRDALLHAQSRGSVSVVPRSGAFLNMSIEQASIAAVGIPAAVVNGIARSDIQVQENVLHLLDARRLIEVELVGRAAERCRLEDLVPARKALEAMYRLSTDAPRETHVDFDVRFHVAIGRLSGNSVLSKIQESLIELLRPFLMDVPSALQHRDRADRSHALIYAALVENRIAEARAEMQSHLDLAYNSLLGEMRRVPSHPQEAKHA